MEQDRLIKDCVCTTFRSRMTTRVTRRRTSREGANSLFVMWVVLLAWFVVATDLDTLQAQDDHFPLPEIGSGAKWDETYRAEDRFPPPPREWARALTRGYEAYAAGEMSEAIGWLEQVINRASQEDFLVRGPDQQGQAISMNWAAHRLICALPAKQRELFRIRYEAVARRELEQAIAARDNQAVNEVMRRYAYTDAGMEAGLLLGYQQFQHGRPGLASSLFRRLRMIPEAREKHDPNLTVLMALCFLMSDQAEDARDILNDLKVPPGSVLNVGGRDARWFRADEDPLQWLSTLVKTEDYFQPRDAGQWLVAGGGWDRMRPSGSGFPMKTCRWEVPRVNDLTLEKSLKEYAKGSTTNAAGLSVAACPVVVDRTVVARSFNRVIGIDLLTGRRTWYYPAIESVGMQGGLATHTAGVESESIQQWMQRQAGADDLASDGKHVFFIEQPESDPSLMTGVWINGGRSIASGSNQLIALDVQKQGSLRWIVGGTDGTGEPALAGAFFLGPPLPIENDLYSIVFLDGLVQLVQLDSNTGKLRWQQALATVDSVVRLDDGTQQSLSPAYSNGVLVCPTGLGVAIGIDLATRDLIWGVSYQQQAQVRGYSRSDSESVTRWIGSAVQIIGRSVVISPQESEKLFCVDLLTGQQMWDNPQPTSGRRRVRNARRIDEPISDMNGLPRGDYQWVAAADGNVILNVGRDRVRAVGLNDGAVIWEKELPDNQQINGTGFFNNGRVWLPTVNSQILSLKIMDGEVEASVEMPWPIQAMVCNDKDVIAMSLEHVGAFFQGEVAEKLFQQLDAASENVGTSEAKIPLELQLFKSQLLRYQKEWAAAIDLLDQVCQQQPTLHHQELLAGTVLDALRDDVELADRLLDRYGELLEQRDRVAFLRYRIEGLVHHKQSDAIEVLLQLAELPADTVTGQVWFEGTDAAVEVSWPQWAAVQFAKLQQDSLDDSQQASFIEKLKQHAAQCLHEGRVDALLRRCLVLGRTGITAEQQFQLAEILSERGEISEAQWVLTPLLSSFGNEPNLSELHCACQYLAAQLLWDAGYSPEAVSMLEALSNDPSAQSQTLQQRWKASLEQWKTEWQRRPITSVSHQWSEDVPQKKNWYTTDWQTKYRFDVSEIVQSGTWLTFDVQQNDSKWNLGLSMRWRPNEHLLEVYDELGELKSTIVLESLINRRVDPRMKSRLWNWGTQSVTSYGNELICFDWLNLNARSKLPQTWARDLASSDWELLPSKELGAIRSAVEFVSEQGLYRRSGSGFFGAVSNVTADGFLVDSGSGLYYVNAINGELRWKRSFDETVLAISQDEKHFYVYGTAGMNVTLDKTSGKLLQESMVPFESTDEVMPAGRFVVCKSKQSEHSIRVWDLHQKRWAWDHSGEDVRSKSVQLFLDANAGIVAWVTDSGRLHIADLETGQALMETAVDKGNYVGLEIQSRPDCWLVVLKTKDLVNWHRSTGTVQCAPVPEAEELLDGYLYCFDKQATVEAEVMRWRQPIRLECYCLLENQIGDFPFAMFSSRVSPTRAIRRGQDMCHIAVLDLRDGQVILEKSAPTTYRMGMSVDPHDRQLRVQMGATAASLTWGTETNRPPCPLGSLKISESTELLSAMSGE